MPAWYRDLKTSAMPLLGTAPAMAAAARAAGLAQVRATERAVDVGIAEPIQLVRYRPGHPIFASWLDRIGPQHPAALPSGPSRPSGPRWHRTAVGHLPARAHRHRAAAAVIDGSGQWMTPLLPAPGMRAPRTRPDKAVLSAPRGTVERRFELVFVSGSSFPCWSYLCSNNRHGSGHARDTDPAARQRAHRAALAPGAVAGAGHACGGRNLPA